jgi:hypothetical protein
MSITLGIYDFFSYTVPGIFYILVINRLLMLLNLPSINIGNLDISLGGALLWFVVSYVVGHLMDSFAIRLYYAVNKFHAETIAMKEFREKNKNLDIDFTINNRQTLFSVIRHNDMNLALYIDNFKAISIMLNNISLALLLLSVVEVIEIIVNGYSVFALIILVSSLGFSYVAITRSALFNKWHWAAVYNHARQYGKSIPEMFEAGDKKKAAGND